VYPFLGVILLGLALISVSVLAFHTFIVLNAIVLLELHAFADAFCQKLRV